VLIDYSLLMGVNPVNTKVIPQYTCTDEIPLTSISPLRLDTSHRYSTQTHPRTPIPVQGCADTGPARRKYPFRHCGYPKATPLHYHLPHQQSAIRHQHDLVHTPSRQQTSTSCSDPIAETTPIPSPPSRLARLETPPGNRYERMERRTETSR
jgi:hypothetical protein